jgi:uncharacterized protein YecE (DUF72 family)
MDVWIGTSGYSYPDWVGGFYPPGTPASRMLPYYATHFPLVELNFTYYRLPTASDLRRLLQRVPAGFQFTVKLHQSLSHEQDLKNVKPFRDAIEVLRQEGRLLALLCQYPQRFHHNARNLARLAALAEAFGDYTLAVEFRHSSWNHPEVPAWLNQHGLHLVSVDVPAIPALYPSGLVQCSRLIYVRFHSRRSASWYESEKERYDYLYTDDELHTWLDALASRQGLADRALLLFNNCRRAQAAENAQRIRELLNRLGPQFTVVPPFASQNVQQRQGLLF